MAWDDDKATATDPDNPTPDEQLTADEWDQHVLEGHFPSDELNFGTDGSGNPVVTDPQNADQVVATYNRATGSWELVSLTTERASITQSQSRVSTSGDKTIPSGTITKIDYDTVEDDSLGAADTANDQFVIPYDGKYLVNLSSAIKTPANSDTTLLGRIHKNDTFLVQGSSAFLTSDDYNPLATLSISLEFVQGDTIDTRILHQSGADQLNGVSQMSIARLG